MVKCLEINMYKAVQGGAENFKKVCKMVDNLKGSKNQFNQTLYGSIVQAHFSGVIMSNGTWGETKTSHKIVLPLDNLVAVDGVNVFDRREPVAVMACLCDGLDIVEIEEN